MQGKRNKDWYWKSRIRSAEILDDYKREKNKSTSKITENEIKVETTATGHISSEFPSRWLRSFCF